MLHDDRELRQEAGRAEAALAELEGMADTRARSIAFEAVQSLVELYGSGLQRITDSLRSHDPSLLDEIADDELVGHLLILHDLHPLKVEGRVLLALEDVRPYLQSHGGDVELLEIDQGVARIRLEGTCNGCPSSASTLKLAIEEAMRQRAPDVERVEAVNLQPAASEGSFIPLTSIHSTHSRLEQAGQAVQWETVSDLDHPTPGNITTISCSGEQLIVLWLEQAPYAYRDRCASCGGSLADGEMLGDVLTCKSCQMRYDVHHAGVGIDDPKLHLEPLPLLHDGPTVQIALRA